MGRLVSPGSVGPQGTAVWDAHLPLPVLPMESPVIDSSCQGQYPSSQVQAKFGQFSSPTKM